MMKNLSNILASVFMAFIISSCTSNDITEPIVSNSETDIEIISRFVDINTETNEYFINKNKKTRALSYVKGSDAEYLERVSPLNIEKYENNLEILNSQVAEAIADPNISYIVFSVNGKTLIKKLKENTNFDFSISKENVSINTRALLPVLNINGGSNNTTGVFYDASRTLRMEVKLNPSIQYNYYFFQVSNPNAKPNPNDNSATPESVAFSGTGPLWNTMFTWTAYWDAKDPNKGFKWEFKGKGTTPSYGFIAECSFSK